MLPSRSPMASGPCSTAPWFGRSLTVSPECSSAATRIQPRRAVRAAMPLDSPAADLKRVLSVPQDPEEDLESLADSSGDIEDQCPAGTKVIAPGLVLLPPGEEARSWSRFLKKQGNIAHPLLSQGPLESLYRESDAPEKRYYAYSPEHSAAETKAEHEDYQPSGRQINNRWSVIHDPHEDNAFRPAHRRPGR